MGSRGSQVDGGIVRRAPGASLAGQVRSARGGCLAGAAVRCGTLTTATGEDGCFVLRGVPAGAATLAALAPGHLGQEVTLWLDAAAEPAPVTITLEACGSFHGTVVDEDGLPVSGAIVRLVEPVRTRTDAAGRFEFPLAAERASPVTVTHPDKGYCSGELVAGVDSTLRLAPQGRLLGLIQDPSGETGRCEVEVEHLQVSASGDGSLPNPFAASVRWLRPDSFEVRGLFWGVRYRVSVVNAVGFRAVRVVAVGGRDDGAALQETFVLEGPVRVRGRVRGPRNETLPGAEVTIAEIRPETFQLFRCASARSDAEGLFSFAGRSRAEQRLLVRARGFGPHVVSLAAALGPEAFVDVVLPAPAALSGTATLSDPSPARRPRVFLRHDNDVQSVHAAVDEAGRFRMEGLAPGGATLFLIPVSAGRGTGRPWSALEEDSWVRRRVDLPPGGEARVDIAEDLTASGEIRVELEDGAGDPLPEHGVAIRQAGDLVRYSATTSSGEAVFPDLAPGSYQVLLDDPALGFPEPGNAARELTVSVAAGQVARLVASLAVGSLVVEVVDEAGRPRGDAEVNGRKAGREGWGLWRAVEPDGTARFRRLLGGDYELEARASGRLSGAVRVTVAPGRENRARLVLGSKP
ncbi:MAG: carboxypeptidase regulatory-like domain-containing protein [Planctomycetes bacterium]|nr:carboxypeptidase regulatory-like domain-containing protein [Planctomycetota bacterium]